MQKWAACNYCYFKAPLCKAQCNIRGDGSVQCIHRVLDQIRQIMIGNLCTTTVYIETSVISHVYQAELWYNAISVTNLLSKSTKQLFVVCQKVKAALKRWLNISSWSVWQVHSKMEPQFLVETDQWDRIERKNAEASGSLSRSQAPVITTVSSPIPHYTPFLLVWSSLAMD